MRKRFLQLQTSALLTILLVSQVGANTLKNPTQPTRFLASEEFWTDAHVPVPAKGPATSQLVAPDSFLELTDAQLEKIAEFKSEYELSTAGKRVELDSLIRQIGNLLNQPIQMDRNEIFRIHEKVSSINSGLSLAHLTYLIKMTAELTPDQRKELRHAMLAGSLHGPEAATLAPFVRFRFAGPIGARNPFGPPPPFGMPPCDLPFGLPPFGNNMFLGPP